MSASPALATDPTGPDQGQQQRDADAQYYRRVLHELIEIGADLARALRPQAAAQPDKAPAPTPSPPPTPPSPSTASPARSAAPSRWPARSPNRQPRRARPRSARPRPAPPSRVATPLPPEHRRAAREQITHEVEDTIQHEAKDRSEAAALRAELRECLDDPGLDLEIADRPIEDIIADICLDLGIDWEFLDPPWMPRTPANAPGPNAHTTRQGNAQPGAAPPGPTPTSTGPPP